MLPGSYLLFLHTFSWQAHSCQVSSPPHMMPTPTYHLQTDFFLRTEALLSLPKSPHSPLLWNKIPDLIHVLVSVPLFSILLKVLLSTVLFCSNSDRKCGHNLRLVLSIQLATKSYDTSLPHQSLVVVVSLLSHGQLFCDPMGSSLPGSSVHGISQGRILEWVAISFSRESSQPRD